LIERDTEGSGRGIFKSSIPALPGGTEDNQEKFQSGQSVPLI
jgi:hypothetical protein